jgi:hypothetical protein
MSDVRKGVDCDYCGTAFHIKYPEEEHPQFCCFCGESFDNPDEVEDEDDDGDLDYDDSDLN